MNADLILSNLVALTPHPATRGRGAGLIAIRDGRILHVGDRSDHAALTGPHTRVVDCQGATVVAGFNDAHCHPVAFAMTTRYVDCSPARIDSIPDLIDILRGRAARLPAGKWLRAANYDPTALAEQRPPNRWELDRASPMHPVILVERAGQHCVLNSRALALCGIDEATGPSDAGAIGRDPASGLVNGVVSGNHAQVAASIPPLARDEIDAGLHEANRLFLQSGITSLQDTSWSNTPAHWHAMADYKRRGLLAPRVSFFVGADAVSAFAAEGWRTGSLHPDCERNALRIGAAKIALDESTGNPRPPQALLDATALAAHRAGFQLAFHVPDVALLDRSLNALAYLRERGAAFRWRPRFEHCPACPAEWLDRLAASGATVVAQPALLPLAVPAWHEHEHDPGEPSLALFPFRSFLRHGIPLAFGSDAPLGGCAPLDGLKAAVTRRDEAGRALAVDEAISVSEAWRCYTRGGACAAGEDDVMGALVTGHRADLAVVAGAGEWADAGDLERAGVVMTLIDGKIAWAL